MHRSAIFAIDAKGGFGKGGGLPWCFPAEMAWFRAVTTEHAGSAVIMGRRTWESLPEGHRPLPGRVNIVVTSRSELEGAPHVVTSLDNAYDCASATGASHAFVIGGKGLLEDAWVPSRSQAPSKNPLHSMHVTMINGEFDCDVTLAPPEHLTPHVKSPRSTVLHRDRLTNRLDGRMYDVIMVRVDVT